MYKCSICLLISASSFLRDAFLSISHALVYNPNTLFPLFLSTTSHSHQNCFMDVEIGASRENLVLETMEEQEKSRRLILVAVDESEESINALQWALHNLFKAPDRIILVHAQRSPISPFATGSPGFMVPFDVLKMLENDMKKSVQKVLAKASEICRAKNVTPETEAHIGDAREVICNAAKKYNPDMLVLGSHEYGAFTRVLIGSVSDYCVHHVQCPVIVVKPKKNQAH